MPDLDKTIVDDITLRLRKYLSQQGSYDEPEYLASGGSAAVYRVNSANGIRVFKGFNPSFFQGKEGASERRRLDIQRRLIGHHCPTIVQTFSVVETEGTAFIEMEYLAWPSLKNELANIPDDAITTLITQLVEAVRYLEKLELVHRDIKPENIHISPDFKQLKLLDLGVTREFETPDADDAALTDHGNARPFLATAQYSSPEYLFRLDPPSLKLWKGLNFYQVGAVLHDLIMKRPLFQSEMGMQNRWLVARAVLTKSPSFADGDPNRLAALKSLAARCLVKNSELRMQLVGWDDFTFGGTPDPIAALKERLTKSFASINAQAKIAAEAKLNFERNECMGRITNDVRANLINVCGTRLPLVLTPPAAGESLDYKYTFSTSSAIDIRCEIGFTWQEELYSNSAAITLKAKLFDEKATETQPSTCKAIGTVTTGEAEETTTHIITSAIAAAISKGLDLLEGHNAPQELIGFDLLNNDEPEAM